MTILRTSFQPLRRLATAVFALGLAAVISTDVAANSDKARRIVAIGGSISEIVFALGEDARLIARDSTSIFPEKVADLPNVGYMRALSPEGVLSVDPDLIIALEGSGPPEAVAVLRSADIPYAVVREAFSRAGIVEKVRAVGEALGVETKASALAADLDRQLAAAEAEAQIVGVKKKVLFILSLRGGKILASGSGTAADGIIRMAGGVNAISGFPGYKQLTDEAVITAAPDVVLMMDRGGGHTAPAEAPLDHPAIRSTPAAGTQSVVRMNGQYLLGFGPRTAAAVRDLHAALYAPRPVPQ